LPRGVYGRRLEAPRQASIGRCVMSGEFGRTVGAKDSLAEEFCSSLSYRALLSFPSEGG
jgi:hypothetical protein